MNNTIHTETYRGYEIEIHYDNDAESPREFCENLGLMSLFHKGYNLPNELDINPDNYDSWQDNWEELKKKYDIVLPICGYEHGGLSIYIGETYDRWDGGFLGFIATNKDRIKDLLSEEGTIEEATEILKGEVETLNSYINGEVYGFTVDEIDEACWNYIGDYEYALKDAKNSIDYHIKYMTKLFIKHQKEVIRNRVPLLKRKSLKIT